jgi:hypothetical protein
MTAGSTPSRSTWRRVPQVPVRDAPRRQSGRGPAHRPYKRAPIGGQSASQARIKTEQSGSPGAQQVRRARPGRVRPQVLRHHRLQPQQHPYHEGLAASIPAHAATTASTYQGCTSACCSRSSAGTTRTTTSTRSATTTSALRSSATACPAKAPLSSRRYATQHSQFPRGPTRCASK